MSLFSLARPRPRALPALSLLRYSSTTRKMPRPPFKEVEAARPDFDAAATPVVTKTPTPGWKPGDGLNTLPASKDFEPANATWRSVDPGEEGMYKMMISAITPRPIAFVSSLSKTGVPNLAPLSFFNAVCHDPPTIMISLNTWPGAPGPEGQKDTANNIRETGEFCTSIISDTWIEAANYTSIDAPANVDEWKLSGLTPRASETVRPPHVAEAAFSMECVVDHLHEVRNDNGALKSVVVLGRVKKFQAKEFIFDPKDRMRVLPEKLRAVSRLGGISYGRTLQMLELERPTWKKVKDTPEVQKIVSKL